MSALALKYKLRQLQRRFDVVTDAVIIPLSPPTEAPITILSGIASAPVRDLDHVVFEPGALYWDRMPKLHLKHDESRTVGTITQLRYNLKGELLVTAEVTDTTAARYNSWSVGVRAVEYSLHNQDSPQFHAVIHKAECTEISLTDIPSCPASIVTERRTWKPSPLNTWAELMIQRVTTVQKMIGILQWQLKQVKVVEPEPEPPPTRRQSDFSRLVSQLQERHST